MQKRKMALLVAGALLFTTGLSAHLNREKSDDIASRVFSYSESVDDDDFLVSAHRGFSSLQVENTVEALSLASEKNYIDYIEMDARLTKDHRLVLSHDNQLLISPDCTQEVSSSNYDSLMEQSFYYGSMPNHFSLWRSPESGFLIGRYVALNGEEFHLCGLLEGIEACRDKKILLDLKFQNDIEEFVEELKKELKDVDTSNIIFQSLNLEGIRYLRDHSDYTCLALISSSRDLDCLEEFPYVGLKSSLLTPELIEKICEEDRCVALWTIDSSKELNRVVDLLGDHYQDVIYITDYPDFVAMMLQQKQYEKTKR